MSASNESLPPGWHKLKKTRPSYRRADGYVVKRDAPGKWGVRVPGSEKPFIKHAQALEAIAYVDEQWPLSESPASPDTSE